MSFAVSAFSSTVTTLKMSQKPTLSSSPRISASSTRSLQCPVSSRQISRVPSPDSVEPLPRLRASLASR